MTSVASGNTMANHSLMSISKYASYCKSNGGFVVEPPTISNLYGLVHIEYESKLEEPFASGVVSYSEDVVSDSDIHGEMIETPTPTPTQNQRFYVDETNMIERRFLADDTSKFKEKRDSDPFATSVLHDMILDCIWEYLNIEDNLKSLRQEIFLNGIKNKETTDQQNMIVQIARNEWRKHSVDSIRHTRRWVWDSMDETRAMTLLWNFLASSGHTNVYDTIAIIGIIWSKTIVVEKSSLNQWIEFGARPGKDSDEMLWIREVPDGFLGVSSTAGVVREYTRRLKMTGHVYTSDTFIVEEKQPYKVPTIAGIQEILTKNGIEYTKKDKKPELTRLLDQKLLWEIY
jgi:hypothetical protein